MAKTAAEKSQKQGFFRGLMRTFFDLPRWVGARQYINVNKTLAKDVKNTLRIAKPQRQETFEAALQRLKLTEQDLKNLITVNHRGFIIMLTFIAVLCLYGIYLIYHGFIAATFLILAVIILSGVRAFQFSFWNFQIRHRQLGASFLSWWRKK